jgi:hypothetical protein
MTALVTFDDAPVIDMRLCMPRVGVWHADVSVDSQKPITGKQTINVDGNDFIGTVRRGDVSVDVGVYRVVGGAGGLQTPATPKAYNSVSANIILKDLLATAGETLSSTVDPALLATSFAFWVTSAAPVGVVLAQLVGALGDSLTWRMLPDGTLWLGTETWPLVTPDTISMRQFDDRLGKFTVTLADGAMVLPGTAFNSSATHVSYVELEMADASRLDAEVWFE